MSEPQPEGPRSLPFTIPPEVQQASLFLQNWFIEQGIKQWQINGVCSRVYAMAIQQCAPKLHALDPRTNGDATRAQEHNSAVKQLKALVYKV